MNDAAPSPRMARRAARIARRRARFAKPIIGSGARLRAWINALFVDHQIFRVVYPNRWRLAPDAWRSGQPTPGQIRGLRRKGVRTVVNLRGPSEFGSYALERDACAAEGLDYRELKTFSSRAPRPEMIETADRAFADIAYPAVFHCKSGADRAGFAAALFLILRENRPVAEARRQLHWRYGHSRLARTGVLDAFFDLYEAAREDAGRRGETLDFRRWVREGYDPDALDRSFRARKLHSFVVDRLLGRE